METPTQITPPPSSAKSAAQPISAAELQRELSGGPPVTTPPPTQTITEPVPPPNDFVPPEEIGKRGVPSLKEALRKRVVDNIVPEEKKEVPAEVKTKAETPPVEAKITDEELGVLPHDSKRTRERIIHLNTEKKRIEGEKDVLKKELEEAKKLPATPANAEEVAKLKEEYVKSQDELTKFRRRYDLDNDAEFKARYDEPVKAAEQTIAETFKKVGLGDNTLKAIQDAGGFAAFSRSQKIFTVNEADEDNPGEMKAVSRTAAELAKNWLNNMNVADAEDIKASIGKQQLLQSEKKQAVEKAVAESNSYFDTRQKNQTEAQARSDADVKAKTEEYETWAKKAETETEWLKDQAVPDNATPETKKALAEQNKWREELRNGLRKHPSTAAEYGVLRLEAAEASHLRRTTASLESEIASLKEQLTKTKGALKTTGKGGSLLVKDGERPKEDAPPGSTNWKDSLRKRVLGPVEE